jgi:hypothetical protein
MPDWVSGNEPAPTKTKETTRLVQKPGLLYGDSAKQQAPAKRKAAKSPFLPDSSNSRFFGGKDCIESPGHKCR